MNSIIKLVRDELLKSTDEKTRASGQNFFKEKIKFYGVKTSDVTRISKECFKLIKDYEKSDIYSLCEILWQSGYLEESFVACSWSYYIHKQYEPDDFTIFARWINNYVNNWASCDTLCNHTVGEFIEMYPDQIERLKEFTSSGNRWVKRSSAVSLIIPARKGLFLDAIFEIADSLLEDKDDLVQKGYGWMLKAASEAHRMEIFDFVMKRKSIMPRTALRYSIEKMPEEMRKKAMMK